MSTSGSRNRAPVVLWSALFTAALLSAPPAAVSASGEYRTVEWVDLIPPEDLQVLLNPPAYLAAIQDGSVLDKLDPEGGVSGAFGDDEAAKRYEAALQSTAVREEFDGERIRIPGFIVPLAFDETRMVSEFFLVPYFGACLHSPPPPPNQIIYGVSPGGISLDDIYYPFWLQGTLSAAVEETELGTAAYRMRVDSVVAYEGN